MEREKGVWESWDMEVREGGKDKERKRKKGWAGGIGGGGRWCVSAEEGEIVG